MILGVIVFYLYFCRHKQFDQLTFYIDEGTKFFRQAPFKPRPPSGSPEGEGPPPNLPEGRLPEKLYKSLPHGGAGGGPRFGGGPSSNERQMSMIANGKYRHTYTVTASDITPQYRLTPNAMLMYFQDSFARLMTIHNVAAFDIVKQRRMWVITEVRIDIQPTVTYWSEHFTVELWVSEMTSLRIYCDFRIIRGDNEQLIASGTSQWNILNLDTKRLEPTDFLAEKLQVVPELMTDSHKKVRFPKPQAFDMQMEHRVTRLDLDFNYHVSNRSYVSIALLTMPEEVMATQTVASLSVHWLHETYLADILTCRMSRTDNGCYLHTLTNAEGVTVCELMSRWQQQPETADVSEELSRIDMTERSRTTS